MMSINCSVLKLASLNSAGAETDIVIRQRRVKRGEGCKTAHTVDLTQADAPLLLLPRGHKG